MNAERQVALLRGINVGRAKRVAMADLRKLLGDLGYADVRTLLNSGNVVFGAAGDTPAQSAARIEEALVLKLGVAARATVLDAARFGELMADNSLVALADDPSRLMVSVLNDPADMARLAPLLGQDWTPEALAGGRWAAYLWCPDGVLASRAAAALGALLGDAVTSRNWATMGKLHALLQETGVAG
ncbi:DUF1697 domain-containing protein [Janthinobacterium fluminis]|uniref:DUF1697 domain-containing protein n=1 Tax=Janthinobacterium fluminis TaxID=2987524 RepID=A0ABT5K1E0_9BURK|nr:DUF1697 domain-containing protein [Janthinobacterium fluminis]MDC8758792.1 DUF1697 domain-containing protein [Janthinobacterium fluminis]